MNKKQLETAIEIKRNELNNAYDSLDDNCILKISQELDALLNEYEHLSNTESKGESNV